MLVIDGAGTVARVMAVPRPNDAQFMVGGPFGTPGFDSRGRIVYRGFTRPIKFSRTPGPQPFAAPTLGQHSAALRDAVNVSARKASGPKPT